MSSSLGTTGCVVALTVSCSADSSFASRGIRSCAANTASANGVIAAKVDELFDVLAPNYIARGKQRVDDKRASASTRKKRRRLSARKGRFSAAALGAEREHAIMEVSRERRRGPLTI